MLRKVCFGLLWFVALNIFVGFGIGAVAGMIAGAGESDPQRAFELGRAAGASVAWLKPYVFFASLVVCLAGAAMEWLPGTRSRRPHAARAIAENAPQSNGRG